MSIVRFAIVALLLLVAGCNAKDKIEDAIDSVDPDRKPIDTSIMGVNAFANDSRFGSIGSQFSEVQSTLGLRYVRILFAWNDAVQPSPSAPIDFSFYDAIAAGLPSGMEALVVVTGIPGWMNDSGNWIEGNPRRTFAERWVRKVAERYGSNPRIRSIQIWNEPNMVADPHNGTLQVSESPENYVELLATSFSIVRDAAPSLRVVSAATTAINQNYPETKDYNEGMKAAGVEQFLDVYAIHYYGSQYENVVRPDGLQEYLGSLSKPIWVTESGEQGVNNQLRYVEKTWPFLKEKVPGISRFFYYQFTEATPPDSSYGLRTLDASAPVSDLYVHLRDR